MSNSKEQFTKLFLNGWKQKLCKELDSDELRIEKELGSIADSEPTEIVRLRKAIHEDIEIEYTALSLDKTGMARYDLAIGQVFAFTPKEFWGILINFGSMTGEERGEFFNEYELKVYKGNSSEENMI